MALRGVFIDCDRDLRWLSPSSSRFLLLCLDAVFVHLLAFYLVVLYLVSMSHTIYKDTNEFAGNNDFYVASQSGSKKSFSAEIPVPLQ